MNKVSDCLTISFPELGDERGNLVVIESCNNIPFEIKRVFYIYGSDKDVVRGKHANRKSEFCFINVCGKSKIKVFDTLGSTKVFELDRPHVGVYLPSMLWKDMYDFSEDSILLVLASELYDCTEYIRSFDDFLRIV